MRAARWLAGVVVVAGAIFWARELPWRDGVEAVLTALRAGGPGIYFLAMAVVPLPLAWFTVPAGEAFAEQLSLGGVIAAALVAVAIQLALSYAVARYALRPWIERWMRRRGHVVPQVTTENALSIVLLVRLTPGPPMILGSCLLAIAGVPFRLYWLLSWLVAFPWVVGGVVLGRGVLAGNVKLAAAGFGLLVAAMVVTRWWRRRGREGKRMLTPGGRSDREGGPTS